MAHRHGHRRIGALLGVHPDVGELGDFGIVGRDRHRLGALVAHLGEEVSIGRACLRHVGAPGDDVAGVEPVGRFGHVGLLAPHLRAARGQIAVPVVKAQVDAAEQTQVAAARRVADHRHGGDRREADDAVGPVLLDGVDVACGDDLVDLVPARAHEATQTAHALIFAPLRLGLDDGRPRVHGIVRQARLAPHFQQPSAHQRILHAVCAIQVPAVTGAARAAARLVVGHVPARARVVGLLGFPGDDAALDVDLPRARTGAVDAVGGAHDLVVRPAVAVGVFPGAVFAGGDAVVAGERLLGLRKVVQSIEKMAHGIPRKSFRREALRQGFFTYAFGAQVEPPVQDQAQGVEHGEAVHRELRRAGLDLVADHDRGDEGAVGGDRRGPAQHRAGLLAVEDHADGAEGRAVADAAGEEQHDEETEKRREILLGRGRGVGLHHHVAHRDRGDHHHRRDDLRDDRAADLVGNPAADRAHGRADEGADPGVGQDARRVRVVQRVLHHAVGVGHMADAEDHLHRQRQRHREADERAEGHDVQRRHRPGVLVAEDLELLGDALLHRAEGRELHHQQRADDVERNGHPHADEAEAGRLRQVQVQAEDGGHEGQRVQVGDLGERDERMAGVRRDRLQVVHAEPAQDGQRHQRQQPGEAGVLDIGGRAGGDLAEDPAAVLQQRHRLAAEAAEDAHRHHQRDHDLHGGHAEVAEPGVEAQRRALQPLREEGADVGHGTGEVAAAHAAPQRHQLERPQRPVLVLQHDAGAQGRGQQHRGGQEDGVAPARQADQERGRDAHRRAGDAGDRGQREQLGLGEREAQVEHLHRDDAPHAPDGEAAQQRRAPRSTGCGRRCACRWFPRTRRLRGASRRCRRRRIVRADFHEPVVFMKISKIQSGFRK